MLVEQGIQTFGVEEATGALAVQHLADLGVPRLFPQPLGERGDEALLGHGGRGLRQHAGRGGAQGDFRLVAADALGGGKRARQGEHLAVEEGNAQLQRRRHGHLVRLQEDVLLKPGENVGGLHGRDLVGRIPTRFPAAYDFREQGRCELPGCRGRRASGAHLRRQEPQRFGPGEIVLQSDIALG